MEHCRIAQISDIHIDEQGAYPCEVDVRKNFLSILNLVISDKADHIVLTGDLCAKKADADIYKWVKARLDSSAIPYTVIPGNHDSPALLSEAFGLDQHLSGGEIFFEKAIAGVQSVFLDTSGNILSDRGIEFLSHCLTSNKGRAFVFMHHPPLLADVFLMDTKYPLKNSGQVKEMLLSFKRRIHVFCGHYHLERTVSCENVDVFLSPAGLFQIDADTEVFRPGSAVPGCRFIDVFPDRLVSYCRYANH